VTFLIGCCLVSCVVFFAARRGIESLASAGHQSADHTNRVGMILAGIVLLVWEAVLRLVPLAVFLFVVWLFVRFIKWCWIG
jgi:hypothetical protein